MTRRAALLALAPMASAEVISAPGEDAISIVDIGTDPANPKIIANLDLMNSIFGPESRWRAAHHGLDRGGTAP